MNKLFWPVLLALSVTACGTTSTPATVEDRTEPTPTATAPVTPAAGAESTGVADSQVTSNALATDPRKDPASPLSKRSVYFDFDSYVVKDEYRSMLEAHAGYLKSKSDARLILQGNADERGSREYNLALGQKRAEAVRKALAVLGVSNAQVEAISFGEEKPRATGSDEAAYAENRRADVVYGDE
ncbi:MAG: peptidoglycan-associated lipoprotein Pal [Thiobacillus sp.]|jgi:peptidoglycan-associated lipoprotein|uniref:peptidoglycan-associated lipoprotein Pal n=1 Tax=Thiobacillus sp. TaxID=924 RepID=UPI002893BB0D|nr:peptidoglycan-associated lipoprotein Pal [Thiobacillus sp.]MDT3705459.1 peptidoglycan-associated lipoprotein Pal [Thiobacillus sp.]